MTRPYPLSVVVLAAGQGKRMNSDRPKVLQPLAGRPLLEHVLDTARLLAPEAMHVVYGHGGETVRAAVSGDDCHWVLQAEQLGTGHAVAQAMPFVPDDHRVLVLCGDVPLVQAPLLERLLRAADELGPSLDLITARLADPTGYGRILRDAAGRVVRIVEQRDATAEQRAIGEINTGLIAAHAASLRHWLARIGNDNAQREYYLTDVIALAVQDGVAVHGIAAEHADEVLGINDRAQLAQAERIVQARVAAGLLAAGVTLADPARLDVRGRVHAGRDVEIDVGVVLEGEVTLGDGVRIGPYCHLIDSTLGARTRVHGHCVIERSVLGADCEIGPFARLRPGNEFAERVKVGNFVEVKNSRIAAGSKMNHLAYVGDSELGRDVNFGAGSITCNYDGANKNRTTIGDGVFVGSGCMLVAPVEIGPGATIGAGSTISKNVPGDRLTVARARQVTVDGWQRPVKKPKAKTQES